MTDLLTRPILRVSQTTSGPTRPIVLSALIAAAWAAVTGLIVTMVVCVVVWFAGNTGSFGDAIRAGGLAWLVGNGSGLEMAGLSIGAVPLGLLLTLGWLLYRSGRWAGCTSPVSSLRAVAVGTAVLCVGYAAIALVVASVARLGDVHAPFVRSVAVTAALALAFGGFGILRGSGQSVALLVKLPEEAQAAVTGAVAGIGVMVAAGALLVAASVGVHFSTAVRIAEGMHSGLVGGAVLALVGAAMVPNAVLCAGAFLAGPGFAVGASTAVAPGSVHLGPLPTFPLLAALPRSGAAPWWETALIVVPVVAGAIAGLIAVRRYPVYGLDQAALRGALAGLLGGLGFGAITVLATGSVGPGRMQHVGPDVWPTMLVCAVAFLLGGATAAIGARWLGRVWPRRAEHPNDQHRLLASRQAVAGDDEDTAPIPTITDLRSPAGQ
ncbi:MAG: cell division protein PerM [Nocardioidaceae bacterium]